MKPSDWGTNLREIIITISEFSERRAKTKTTNVPATFAFPNSPAKAPTTRTITLAILAILVLNSPLMILLHRNLYGQNILTPSCSLRSKRRIRRKRYTPKMRSRDDEVAPMGRLVVWVQRDVEGLKGGGRGARTPELSAVATRARTARTVASVPFRRPMVEKERRRTQSKTTKGVYSP